MFITLVQDLEEGQNQTPLGSLDTGLEMASDRMRVENLEPEAWEDDLDLEAEVDDLDPEVDDLDLEAEADDLDLEVENLDLEADDLDLEADDLGQDDRDHEAKSAWEKM